MERIYCKQELSRKGVPYSKYLLKNGASRAIAVAFGEVGRQLDNLFKVYYATTQ